MTRMEGASGITGKLMENRESAMKCASTVKKDEVIETGKQTKGETG